MRINPKVFYSTLFVIVLLSQLYVGSFRVNIVIQLVAIGIYLLFDRVVLNVGVLKKISPLFYLLILGFVGTLVYMQPLFSMVKDISHTIKPLLGVLIGYLFFKKINDFRLFVKIIIFSGFASGIIHFLVLIITGDLFSGSLEAIRHHSRDNFLELVSLFLLLFYKRFYNEQIISSNLFYWVVLIVLLSSNIMYFSRTMIVAAIILLVSFYGYTMITVRTLYYSMFLVACLGLLYVYLYSVNIERDGPGVEAFFYKVKIAPAELFKYNIDREDHRDLWDHWRGYEAKRAFELMNQNPMSFMFGNGFGSTVNLRFYAPLDDTPGSKGLRYISELHNGYVYILYKLGIVGLIIYISMLLKWYYIINLRKNMITILISGIALIYIFTTLTITGVYNSRDIFIFLLGALFHFNTLNLQPAHRDSRGS